MTSRLAALALALSMTGCGLGIGPKSEKRESHNLDLAAITAVHVDAKDGNVTVSPAGTESGSVVFTKKTPSLAVGSGDCQSNYRIDGTTLVVEVSKNKVAACSIDTSIWVAAATAVDITVANGDATVTAMQGPVTVRAKNGAVDADLASPVGDQPAVNASFASDNGSLKISVRYPPAAGHLAASTRNGSIKIGLADGTAFQVSEQHDNGSFHDGMQTTAGAAFGLDLSSKNGSIKIDRN